MVAKTRMPLVSVEEPSDAQLGATGGTVVGPRVAQGDVSFSSDEIRQQKNEFARMRDHLKTQPRVRIRVREETVVQVNGYGFQIAPNAWVEVPQQIADILEEAGRI